jgi:hypothetical protein
MQKTPFALRPILTAILPWGLFAASALPLLVLAYLGIFTRYLADDYSTAGALGSMGFWKAQSVWYLGWSGRFSFTFLISLFELAGVRLVPWLPATNLFVWCALLYWTLRQLFCTLELLVSKIWTGILANIIIFGTIKSLPEYAQVIFWQTGILTYQTSILFMTLLIGGLLKRFFLSGRCPLAVWEYCAWFLAFFIGGGFSETWAIIQITLTGLALFAFALTKKSPLRNELLGLLLLGFLTSWAALLVIAKSPGNMNRDTVMAELSVDLLRYAILSAFWDLPRFLSEWFNGNTTLTTLLFLTGLSAGYYRPLLEKTKSYVLLGLTLLFGAYILLWAGFIPQYAVMGIRPADRVIIMPMYQFLLAFVLLGLFLGIQLSSRLPSQIYRYVRVLLLTVLSVAMFWIPVRTANSLVSLAPSLKLYAQLWDERDLYLRQASALGEKDVVVDSLRRNPALHNIQMTFWIEGDLQDSSDHWINQMAANYYGLSTITLRR